MMTILSSFSVILPGLYYSKTFSPPQLLHQFVHSETSLKATISGPPPTRPAWLNVSSNPATRFQGFGHCWFTISFLGTFGFLLYCSAQRERRSNSGRPCRGVRRWRVPPVSHQPHLVLGSHPFKKSVIPDQPHNSLSLCSAAHCHDPCGHMTWRISFNRQRLCP